MAPRWIAALVFITLALVPELAGSYTTGQMTRYLTYALLAMSLSLVWGRGGILCFGQAIFFGIGGYAMAALSKGMLGGALSYSLIGLVAAMLLSAAIAAILGYFLFWGRGLSGPFLAIVTLAIALIMERLMSNWYAMGGYNGLLNVPPLELSDRLPLYYFVLAVVALVYGVVDRLLGSPFGIVLTAVKTNPRRAAFFGYEVMRVRIAVFVIGAAVAGLAGALFVSIDGFASPTLIGFGLSTEALIWVALGGKEIILAALLGAIVVRMVEGWLSDMLGDAWLLALGLFFMLSVVLLPQGLIGSLLALARRRRTAR
jgi:urea transport system permease protein